MEPADAERSVPNPAVKKQKQALSKAKARVTKAEQRYGQQAYDTPEQQRRTVRGFKISHAEVGQEIRRLRQTCARLESEITALPARVPVREVMDGAPVIRLERERKIITDTVKMVPTAPRRNWQTWRVRCSQTGTTRPASSCARSSHCRRISCRTT